MMNHRRRSNNFTYVSSCVKYMIFMLNFVFWLFGGLLIGVGLYAFVDKWQATGSVRVENVYDVVLNISLVMLIAGGVVFVVSFAGCVGALRENTCLLKFYSLCLLVFFLLEMGVAIVGFVFPHTLQSLLEESFTDKIIQTYREDPDLQNFIDFGQQEFKCCGLSQEGYLDWGKNEYFNCTSPSVERCGVPFSCCINATDISSGLVNIMCGYKVQMLPVSEASKKVWTSGCIEIVRSWAERNLYTIAGIALGIALSQLFVIYLAKTLEGHPLPDTFCSQQAGGQRRAIARFAGYRDKYKRANGIARPFRDLFIHTVHFVPHQTRPLFQEFLSHVRE
ncbi:Tetraspanin-33 [Trachymyrmex zeteki]|uniref:Tetraspanin-33 n=1 Tax=Mycetomoellerius zeteki TaxID=64791 RepID=A0A151WKG9_9HYME|nr:Tetraspanin-33 [Trachymyrmex zeteki]